MSRRQRIIVVALAVLTLLLFVASVGNQRRSGDGGAGAAPGGLTGVLADWLGGAAGADPEDVGASCTVPDGRLVFGGSCTVEVAAADSSLRLVRLRAEHRVTVTAPAPAGDYTVTAELDRGDTTQLAIGSDGAEIGLRCRSSDDCVVRIGAGDE